MVLITLSVLLLFVAIAFTADDFDHFAGLWDAGIGGITLAAASIFFGPAAALVLGVGGGQPAWFPRHAGRAGGRGGGTRCGATRPQVPMRAVMFAVRGRTMYPPGVGLRAENSVLEAWAGLRRSCGTAPCRCSC